MKDMIKIDKTDLIDLVSLNHPLTPNFQHLAPMSYLSIANTVDGAVFPEHSGSRGWERGIILIAGGLLDGHQAKSAGAVIGFQFYRVSAVVFPMQYRMTALKINR